MGQCCVGRRNKISPDQRGVEVYVELGGKAGIVSVSVDLTWNI